MAKINPDTLRPRDKEDFEKARDAFLSLAKILNSGRHDVVVAGLLDAIGREHRYLQNGVIWALLTALGAHGHPDTRTDARNESSHWACTQVRDALHDRIYWPDHDPNRRDA